MSYVFVIIVLNPTVFTGAPSNWHGDEDRGAQVSSGVYFYEVRQGGQEALGKMALVR